MTGKNIYIYSEGQYDRSRWLRMSSLDSDRILFELTDLCLPGRVSGLAQIPLNRGAVKDLLNNGAVQITLGRGYALFRSAEDLLVIEFRGSEDPHTCKVTLLLSDIAARLDSLDVERLPADSSAVAIA